MTTENLPANVQNNVQRKHPHDCICERCCVNNLQLLGKQSHPDFTSYCPKCGQKTLWRDFNTENYECLNPKCGLRENDLNAMENSYRGKKDGNTLKSPMLKPIIALVVTLTVSVIALIISSIVGNILFFWLLFGFASTLSLEQWLSYYTKKYRPISIFYRVVLNLSVLSVFWVLIQSVIKFFTTKPLTFPILNSVLIVLEFALFIWLWIVISKNSWRWPSMKLTLLAVACVGLLLSFVGLEPLASYKDKTIAFISPSIQSFWQQLFH
jgi:hypothetical protein